jgi:phosphoglycerate dehydrogenase-like enzyme
MTQDTIRVVVTTPLDEQILRKIRGIDGRIRVDQVSPWILAERKGDLSHKGDMDLILGQAEVLYGWIHHFPKQLLERTPRLKWIQTMSAGIDLMPEAIRNSRIRIVNASGLHGTPMGEMVLEMMLMFAKDAPACFRMKQARQWKRFRPALLKGQTVGILGLGAVGGEIARLCKAFGMTVIGIRRSGQPEQPVPHVDRVFPREQLLKLLAESDYVVLALPLTKETRNLIGEKELGSMKPTAFLINLARGAVVDEGALIRALEEKWIAGAGLDVFVMEPLPPESRFYDLSNVIFSPHISGELPDYESCATEIFRENLRRYLSGEPFLHEIDQEKGY